MIIVHAKNAKLWSALGSGAGLLLGTFVGNSPVGLALGAIAGFGLALYADRPSQRTREPRRAAFP